MVDSILQKSRVRIDFSRYREDNVITEYCPIKTVYVNQLAANNPLEDRWNVGFVQVDGVVSSFLFSVIDGHSGPACSHTVAWALLDYLGASLLKAQKVSAVLEQLENYPPNQPYHIARRLDFVGEDGRRGYAASPPASQMRAFMKQSLKSYLKYIESKGDRDIDPVACLTEACLRLDTDLCSLGHENGGADLKPAEFFSDKVLNRDLLHVLLSGAVGTAGRIFWHNADTVQNQTPDIDLHIANVGDCAAALFSATDGVLVGEMLTRPHQPAVNVEEAQRLAAEHPHEPIGSILRNGGRLLGELAPSRAFGDVRYKWPADRILELIRHMGVEAPTRGTVMTSGPWAGLQPLPEPYLSPPYLTARPEISVLNLTPDKKFLVLATDGLWDVVSVKDASKALSNLQPDECPATTLLKMALTTMPPQMAKVLNSTGELDESLKMRHAASLLSLPPGVARYYRDDITVMVVELTQPN
ncbi:hypothetical protein Ciccas_011068 [Cichlidogyrus casuarinus]|uniref:PPM-type phosphatase domain-containing protein n=1 Tax=Cichlidogyrus casuarinus TaxID=1844966 RepID=A0ABD2PSB5_9PLAT